MNDNEQRSVLEQMETALKRNETPDSKNATVKIPTVLYDFHLSVDKLLELKEKMSDPTNIGGLTSREQADGFIASSVVASVLDKTHDLIGVDYKSQRAILTDLGIRSVVDTFMNIDTSKNEYLSDNAKERIETFYDGFGSGSDQTAGSPDYAHSYTREESSVLLESEKGNDENGVELSQGQDAFGHSDYHIRSISPDAESFLTSISQEDKIINYQEYMAAADERNDTDAESKRVDAYLSERYTTAAQAVLGKEDSTGTELQKAAGWIEKGGAPASEIESAHMKAAEAFDKEGNRLEAYREYIQAGDHISKEDKEKYIDNAIQEAIYGNQLDEHVTDEERLTVAVEETHDPAEIRDSLKDVDLSHIPEGKREEVMSTIDSLLVEKEISIGARQTETDNIDTGMETVGSEAAAADNTGSAVSIEEIKPEMDASASAEGKDTTSVDNPDSDKKTDDASSGNDTSKEEAQERNARNSAKYEAEGKYESAYIHACLAGDKVPDEKKAELLEKAFGEITREEFHKNDPDGKHTDKEHDIEKAIADKNTDGVRDIIESISPRGQVSERLGDLLTAMDVRNGGGHDFKPEEIKSATDLLGKAAQEFIAILKDNTIENRIRDSLGDEKADQYKNLSVEFAAAITSGDHDKAVALGNEIKSIVEEIPEKNDVDKGSERNEKSADPSIADRLMELGKRAYIDPHSNRAIRYQSRNPYQMMAILDYCKFARGISKEDFKAATGQDKPDGLWKNTIITSINLFNSLSVSNIAAVWSEALYQEFIKDANNDTDKDALVEKARYEVVKETSAIKLNDILKDSSKDLTQKLKEELGEDKFEKFKEAIDRYAVTNKRIYLNEANHIAERALNVGGQDRNERFDRRDARQNWDILVSAINARREGKEINFTITGRGTETGPVSRLQGVMAFINLVENSDVFYTLGKMVYETIQDSFFAIFDEKRPDVGEMIEKAVNDSADKKPEDVARPHTEDVQVGEEAHKEDEQSGEEEARTEDNQAGEEEAHTEDEQSGEEEAHKEDEQSGEEEARTEDNQAGEEEAHTEDEQSGEEEAHKEDEQAGEEEAHKEDEQPGEEEARTEDNQAGEEEAHTEDEQSGEEEAHTEDNQAGEEEVHTEEYTENLGDKAPDTSAAEIDPGIIGAIELAREYDGMFTDERPDDASDIYRDAAEAVLSMDNPGGDMLKEAAGWFEASAQGNDDPSLTTKAEETHAMACEAYLKEGDNYSAYKEAMAAKDNISADLRADAIESYAKDCLEAGREDTDTWIHSARLFDLLPEERQKTPEAMEAFEKGAEQMSRRHDTTRADLEAGISWAGKAPDIDPDTTELLEAKLKNTEMNYEAFAKEMIEPVLNNAIMENAPIDIGKFYEEVSDKLSILPSYRKEGYTKSMFVDDVKKALSDMETKDKDDINIECNQQAIDDIRSDVDMFDAETDLVEIDEKDGADAVDNEDIG